ncbi:MAG: hypothetical protein ACXWJ6_06090 [Xanthobacteraceae bacterium]
MTTDMSVTNTAEMTADVTASKMSSAAVAAATARESIVSENCGTQG